MLTKTDLPEILKRKVSSLEEVKNERTENVSDKSDCLEWGDEELEHSIKRSLPQKVNRLKKMAKGQNQAKDSKINFCWTKRWLIRQSQLERASKKNTHLSEELEKSNLEKRDLRKELQEIRAELEGAKDAKENISKELELSKTELASTNQELFKVREEAEKRQQEVTNLENMRKEDDKRLQRIVAIVKKITDDKSRVENEHKGCKIKRDKLEQKISTQAILTQDQVNMIEGLKRELKTIDAEQSENWNSLKKQVQAKSEKVESQAKLIAEQQNKIKRLSENEKWFNLVTEEQRQKAKTRIQEIETKLLKSQNQLKYLKIEIQKVTGIALENLELENKLEEHENKVETSENQLEMLEEQLSATEEKAIFGERLEAKLSDSSKDITWYKTQAKSFSKVNEELQKKLASIEDNASSSLVSEDAKVDDDIDLHVVPDEEKEEEVKQLEVKGVDKNINKEQEMKRSGKRKEMGKKTMFEIWPKSAAKNWGEKSKTKK